MALQHELYLQDNLALVWMQQLDAFVLTERCYRSQQNCASVPDDSPVAVYLRYLDVFKRLDRVGGSDGVLKGGWERGRKKATRVGHAC